MVQVESSRFPEFQKNRPCPYSRWWGASGELMGLAHTEDMQRMISDPDMMERDRRDECREKLQAALKLKKAVNAPH